MSVIINFEYKQPATVTVKGSIRVPDELLQPGREKELKDYITIDAASDYINAKQDIDFDEHPKTVTITLTERRTI
jgi:hypothetical protein